MRNSRASTDEVRSRFGARTRPPAAAVIAAIVAFVCGSAISANAAPSAHQHAQDRKTPATTPSVLSPYFGARFKYTHLSYDFGQAPSWTTNGGVLSGQLDSAGIPQIHRSTLRGSGPVCLTLH